MAEARPGRKEGRNSAPRPLRGRRLGDDPTRGGRL